MVEINENNFSGYLPDIENDIKSSTFIAVDLEFLGLPASLDSKSVSLFDSPEERYEKLRNSVRRFPPCQLGFSCFKEIGDRFAVKTYYLYLFKRLGSKIFSFSVSAATFLSQHKFDFNKFVCNGVTYSNKNEIANIKKEIINSTFNYDNISDNLEKKLQFVKMRILLEANVEEEPLVCETENKENCRLEDHKRIRLSCPIVIELGAKEKQKECDAYISQEENDTILWENGLSTLEEAVIIYELEKEFGYFDFQLDSTRTMLYVAETPLIFRNSSDQKRHKKSLQNLINEFYGVSRIFQCILESRKPIVGHNSLLDFMYIYNYFVNDLPESYNAWKASMLQTFSTVLDTKVLAASIKEKLWSHGVSDLSLQTLSNYIESPSCGNFMSDTPNVSLDSELLLKFEGGDYYHNAGYDSFQTGKLFIKLAYLYAYSKCTTSLKIEWPFQKILIMLNSKIVNRIPIPLIDSEYCYLEGLDPPGQRPDFIHIRKKRRFALTGCLPQSSTITNFFLKIFSYVLPPVQFDSSEFLRLQDDFSRIMGAFRVEMKLVGADLFIATNTDKSFARFCNILSSAYGDYYIVDDENKSYEQHLTAYREKKSAYHKNNNGYPSVTKISLYLTIFLYCLLKFNKR